MTTKNWPKSIGNKQAQTKTKVTTENWPENRKCAGPNKNQVLICQDKFGITGKQNVTNLGKHWRDGSRLKTLPYPFVRGEMLQAIMDGSNGGFIQCHLTASVANNKCVPHTFSFLHEGHLQSETSVDPSVD